MATPFDHLAGVDVAPAGQQFAEPITARQRRTLREMGLEKAQLIGIDLQEADDRLDTWLAELTKEKATSAIRKLGVWLDGERRRQGIPVDAWRSR